MAWQEPPRKRLKTSTHHPSSASNSNPKLELPSKAPVSLDDLTIEINSTITMFENKYLTEWKAVMYDNSVERDYTAESTQLTRMWTGTAGNDAYLQRTNNPMQNQVIIMIQRKKKVVNQKK